MHTPGIYGLFSLQLPLLSGIINPLIYAIMWKPYRRGYIWVLTCSGHTGFRLIKRSPHSGSHTLNGRSIQVKYFRKIKSLDIDVPWVLAKITPGFTGFKMAEKKEEWARERNDATTGIRLQVLEIGIGAAWLGLNLECCRFCILLLDQFLWREFAKFHIESCCHVMSVVGPIPSFARSFFQNEIKLFLSLQKLN